MVLVTYSSTYDLSAKKSFNDLMVSIFEKSVNDIITGLWKVQLSKIFVSAIKE